MSEPHEANRLAGETSPYLLQHAHNPVDWYPWGDEALRRAIDEQKPILLSVGYSACHWCHVMERESFENEAIAQLMNAHFICVKVDREERPDIDHLYMTAVQMLTGQGGWPMTVFLTPEGRPFYGGTYYPPEDRYGRAGFPRVLQAVAEAWRDRREVVLEQAEAITAEIRLGSTAEQPAEPVTRETLASAWQSLRPQFDWRLGGFGGAPKFPQPMILDFLLRFHLRTKREEPLDFVRLTLDRMAFGGMYDQVGGGFHRYSTDEFWLVPHFEKMLYDNAQLARTYLRAWQVTGDALYRRIAEQTLDYALREMTSPAGAFYSTQDADSEGEEGRFFVWRPEEVTAALGEDDADQLCRYYDISEHGNFEGRSIPNVTIPPDAFARSLGVPEGEFLERLDGMRARLYAAREQRPHPGRDEKVVTAWNGMMLAAFAEAGAALDREDYLRAAERNAEFVAANMMTDGRLMRTGKERDGRFALAPIPGFLEDYACFADGLLELYQAGFDRRWLESANQLVEQIGERFADEAGRLFNTASDAEALVDRPRDITDNATPSGSSVAAEARLKLAALAARPELRDSAAAQLRGLAPVMQRHPSGFGRLLCAADLYLGPVSELTLSGSPQDPMFRALASEARRCYRPNVLIGAAQPGDQSSPPTAENPAALLCQDNVCGLPCATPEELAAQLGD